MTKSRMSFAVAPASTIPPRPPVRPSLAVGRDTGSLFVVQNPDPRWEHWTATVIVGLGPLASRVGEAIVASADGFDIVEPGACVVITIDRD